MRTLASRGWVNITDNYHQHLLLLTRPTSWSAARNLNHFISPSAGPANLTPVMDRIAILILQSGLNTELTELNSTE